MTFKKIRAHWKKLVALATLALPCLGWVGVLAERELETVFVNAARVPVVESELKDHIYWAQTIKSEMDAADAASDQHLGALIMASEKNLTSRIEWVSVQEENSRASMAAALEAKSDNDREHRQLQEQRLERILNAVDSISQRVNEIRDRLPPRSSP